MQHTSVSPAQSVRVFDCAAQPPRLCGSHSCSFQLQGFARLAAVHGGTYMLNKPNLEIQFGEGGKFTGVKDDQGEVAKAPLVIGDPSYFPGKTKVTGKVVRAICIMNHAIPNTGDSHSVQIIVSFSQVGRKNDIYVFCSSYRYAI